MTTATILGTLISTYFDRVQEFLNLLETEGYSHRKNTIYFLTVPVIAVMYGGYYYLEPNILDIFFFIGVLNASLLLPMLFIIFTENKHDSLILTTTFLSILTGYLSLLLLGKLQGALTAFITSVIFLGSYYLYLKIRVQ